MITTNQTWPHKPEKVIGEQGTEWRPRHGVRVQQACLQCFCQAGSKLLWHWKQQCKHMIMYMQVKPEKNEMWYSRSPLLTIAIKERNKRLHHHPKRVTVPRVSMFIRKDFKTLHLSRKRFLKTCQHSGKCFLSIINFNLLTCSSGGI